MRHVTNTVTTVTIFVSCCLVVRGFTFGNWSFLFQADLSFGGKTWLPDPVPTHLLSLVPDLQREAGRTHEQVSTGVRLRGKEATGRGVRVCVCACVSVFVLLHYVFSPTCRFSFAQIQRDSHPGGHTERERQGESYPHHTGHVQSEYKCVCIIAHVQSDNT